MYLINEFILREVVFDTISLDENMYSTYMFLFIYVHIHNQPFIQLEGKIASLMIKTWRVTHIHKQRVPPPSFRFHFNLLKEQWYMEPNPHPASYFQNKLFSLWVLSRSGRLWVHTWWWCLTLSQLRNLDTCGAWCQAHDIAPTY